VPANKKLVARHIGAGSETRICPSETRHCVVVFSSSSPLGLTSYGPLFSPSFLRHGPAPERVDHDVVGAVCVLLYSVLVVQCLHAGSCLTLLQANFRSGPPNERRACPQPSSARMRHPPHLCSRRRLARQPQTCNPLGGRCARQGVPQRPPPPEGHRWSRPCSGSSPARPRRRHRT
jgi:hypothetical protein